MGAARRRSGRLSSNCGMRYFSIDDSCALFDKIA
jgi:hypothetical protein